MIDVDAQIEEIFCNDEDPRQRANEDWDAGIRNGVGPYKRGSLEGLIYCAEQTRLLFERIKHEVR